MSKLLYLLQTILTIGRDQQSFIGAWWIRLALRGCPGFARRGLALRVVGWSPHYFYKHFNPAYVGMPHRQYLECEFQRNRTTREKIYATILASHLKGAGVVADYGCGAGFLARVTANHARQVYGIDLSAGVLACGRILNGGPNITYLTVPQFETDLPDGALDALYSIAVIQHMSDAAIREFLRIASRKLRAGSKVVLQVHLNDERWQIRPEGPASASVKDKLRHRYALHFFPRSPAYFKETLAEFGFVLHQVIDIATLCPEKFDDVCEQHLLIAERKA